MAINTTTIFSCDICGKNITGANRENMFSKITVEIPFQMLDKPSNFGEQYPELLAGRELTLGIGEDEFFNEFMVCKDCLTKITGLPIPLLIEARRDESLVEGFWGCSCADVYVHSHYEDECHECGTMKNDTAEFGTNETEVVKGELLLNDKLEEETYGWVNFNDLTNIARSLRQPYDKVALFAYAWAVLEGQVEYQKTNPDDDWSLMVQYFINKVADTEICSTEKQLFEKTQLKLGDLKKVIKALGKENSTEFLLTVAKHVIAGFDGYYSNYPDDDWTAMVENMIDEIAN
ncbi:hypothetical protein ADMFC3_27660 [Geovibrio sp. ADMFC3]